MMHEKESLSAESGGVSHKQKKFISSEVS